MNPQYLPQQQYGASSQNFQNNQGFQSVPLVPPKNGPPTSVSSPSQGPQLNNLLGKLPSGNLTPFTLLPLDQQTQGFDQQNPIDQRQSFNNNMDGASEKSTMDSGVNNNISNGPPKNLPSQIQNGLSQNGSNAGGFSIPSNQLPPSTSQSRPPGPPIGYAPSANSPMPQNRSSPNSQPPLRPSPSFTPSSQQQLGTIAPPSAAIQSPISFGVPQPSNQSNPVSSSLNSMSSIGGPPSGLRGPSSGLGGSPSGLGGTPPGLGAPPSGLRGPSSGLGGPPSGLEGPPSGLGGPPSGLGGPPSGLGAPPSGLGGPPSGLEGTPSGLGGPPSGLGGPSSGLGGPPSNLGGPPSGVGGPPSGFSGLPSGFGGTPSGVGAPPSGIGRLKAVGGLPSGPSGSQLGVGGPLSGLAAPSSTQGVSSPMQTLGGPSSGQPLGAPPPGQTIGRPPLGPSSESGLQQQSSPFGAPPTNRDLQSPPGPTPNSLNQPSQMSQSGPTQLTGQPKQNFSGQQQHFAGSFPNMPTPASNIQGRNPAQSPAGAPPQKDGYPMSQGHLNAASAGQSPMPGQPPLQNQSPYGPPMQTQSPYGQTQLPGRSPMPPQSYGQPPMPGQSPMPQQSFNSPQTPGYDQMPPTSPYHSSQYPNQLNSQMQNMNLSGPRQYPGAPQTQKSPMNGDGPHMPPSIAAQQMKSPSGYPPMPGQQHAMPPGPGGYGQQQPAYPQQTGYPQQAGYQQQAQQRRLDPDQMPSPIQVTTDDRNNRSGVFVTNQKGLVPPLVTTDFVVQDQGNTSPRFIRSTMYNVPVSHDIMKQTSVPFSLVVSPMARLMEGEYAPPIVNFGELGPVRCIRCKAYMCPFMNFVDSGRRFQCAFCKATTDVPAEYFQHLDHTGQRMDRFERPELVLGTYEFIATADYCRDNVLPKPPAVIFVIDVSYNSIKSGLVHLLCSQMKEIIQNLPVDQGHEKSNMKIGFITYDNSVHFYNIKGSLASPQMLVVGDTHEMFMPLLDGFLSTPEESEEIIDALMEQIPTMFANTRETETILLPAILAGVEALKASGCSGKLMVFNTSLPIAEAPGKLKNRDDRKLLGTDKERTILTPQNQAYNQLGQDCVQAGCSVDLFIFNNAYIDIATIGQVSRLSGGEVFKYTYFQADIDGERLIGDIIMDISRPIAFDAIMRVRSSTGIRPTDFYGHFFMSNTTDIELASIDCDKAIALEIKHDDKLQEDEGVYIQSALLYTSCSGQRRLRICNLSLKTCSQLADLYRSCDLDTIINYYSKQCLFKLMDNNPKAVKDAIVARAAQTLATYRKNCASPSGAGQLILPECMKLLPLYINCLLKSDALSGGADMTVDDRSFVMQAVMTMDIPTSVHYFYPRLLPLHDLDVSGEIILPDPIRCSLEKMSEQGVYILENGIHLFLWFGLGVSRDIIQNLFGVQSAIQVNIEQIRLPELNNPFSIAVRQIIEEIRIQRHRHMRLTLVRQREKLEPVFKHFLVEDRGVDGSPSYVDFLCHMHKEIRNQLS